MSFRFPVLLACSLGTLACVTQAWAAPADTKTASRPIPNKTVPPPAGPFNNDPDSSIDTGIQKKPSPLPTRPVRKCGDEETA